MKSLHRWIGLLTLASVALIYSTASFSQVTYHRNCTKQVVSGYILHSCPLGVWQWSSGTHWLIPQVWMGGTNSGEGVQCRVEVSKPGQYLSYTNFGHKLYWPSRERQPYGSAYFISRPGSQYAGDTLRYDCWEQNTRGLNNSYFRIDSIISMTQ